MAKTQTPARKRNVPRSKRAGFRKEGSVTNPYANDVVVVAVDATGASAWRGEAHPGFDKSIDALLRGCTVHVDLGSAKGLVLDLGGCGEADVYRLAEDDVVIVETYPDDWNPEIEREFLARIAVPLGKKKRKLGTIEVRSGAIALLHAGTSGPSARKKPTDGVIVSVPNGTYVVFVEKVGARGPWGTIESRIRLVGQHSLARATTPVKADARTPLALARPLPSDGARLLPAPPGIRAIASVALSADGSLLAAGEKLGPAVAVWKTKDGKLAWTRELVPRARRDAWAQQVTVDIVGKILAASVGRRLSVFDLATGKLLASHELDRPASFVAFAPDPKKVLVGMPPRVHRYDWKSGKKELTVDAHCSSTCDAPSSPDGKSVVLAGTRVYLCDGRSLAVRATGRIKGYACATAFAHDGKTFATSEEGGAVSIWDTRTGKRTNKAIPPPSKVRGIDAQDVAFHPDGKSLAVATEDGYVRLWDIATRKVTRELAGHDTELPGTGARSLRAIAFSPDGAVLYVGAVTKGARGVTAYPLD